MREVDTPRMDRRCKMLIKINLFGFQDGFSGSVGIGMFDQYVSVRIIGVGIGVILFKSTGVYQLIRCGIVMLVVFVEIFNCFIAGRFDGIIGEDIFLVLNVTICRLGVFGFIHQHPLCRISHIMIRVHILCRVSVV